MTNPAQTIRVAVVGASGYSGRDLVRILLGHPRVELVGLFGSDKRGSASAGDAQHYHELFPQFRGVIDHPILAGAPEAILASKPDVVFLATPVPASLALAPALLDDANPPVVIDIAAAFRLKDPAVFEAHYGQPHPALGWNDKAVYGLPEIHRDRLADAQLVACAGCYPTSTIIPIAPLVKAGAIADGRRPIIDATSGVSGAGRAASLKTSFSELSLQPYAVLSHRHQPEINAYAGVKTVFTPHLGQFDRGILSTIHIDLAPGWTGAKVRDLYESTYGDEPFVRILPAGEWPTINGVAHTNFCDIALASDDDSNHLIVVSAIDNLVKGAAGQAVQCMNIRMNFPEGAGLNPRVTRR
jgi:N-acetyl-gamma-glutamyl-phosphate reductase